MFRHRRLLRATRPAVLAVAFAGIGPTLAAQTPHDSALVAFIREVIATNAGLQGRWRAVSAAGRRIPAAGALPDPMVSVGVMSLPTPSFSFSAEPMTQIPLRIEQRFPGFGKRGARTDAAVADSVAADRDVLAVEATLATEAAARFAELAVRRSVLAIWNERLRLADAAVVVAEARYTAGSVPQTDALRARLRRAELEEERLGIDAGVQGALARVLTLRPAGVDDVITPVFGLPSDSEPIERRPMPQLAEVRLLVTEHDPRIEAARANVDRAERVSRIREIDARPDVTVAMQEGLRFAGREPFLTAMVGLTVPLWQGRKQRPLAEAAELEVTASRERFADIESRIQGDAEALHAELVGLERRIRQVRENVLPLAEAASASAMQQYRIGAVDLSTVLVAQDDAYRTRIHAATLAADYLAGRVRLAVTIGEEWIR